MLNKVIFLFLKLSGNSTFLPPLSKEEETEYFKKCKNGDMNARNVLIERNLRLVAHIAKKYYYNGGCDNDDLISIGTIGLIKAIDSYNPDSGTRFATYAGKCLQNEILMFFRSQKKQALESSLSDTVETDKDGNPEPGSDDSDSKNSEKASYGSDPNSTKNAINDTGFKRSFDNPNANNNQSNKKKGTVGDAIQNGGKSSNTNQQNGQNNQQGNQNPQQKGEENK